MDVPSPDPATQAFLRYRATEDSADLERAWTAVHADLVAVAQRIAVPRQDALELVQETYLVSLRIADRFQGGSLLAWLCGILRMLCRRNGSRDDLGLSGIEAVACPDLGPDDCAALAEARQAIHVGVQRLDAPYREVLAMHLFDQADSKEIAERLGRSWSTVRTQLERGLARLRSRLPRGLAPILLALMLGSNGLRASSALTTRHGSPRPLVVRGRSVAALAAVFALALAAILWGGERPMQTEMASGSAKQELPLAAKAGGGTLEYENSKRRQVVDSVAADPAFGSVAVRARWSGTGAPVTDTAVLLCAPLVRGISALRAHLDAMRVAYSDSSGTARFEAVPAGRCQLRLDDVQPLRDFEVLPGQALELDIEVPRPAARVSGVVRTAKGAPVAGATVVVSAAKLGTAPGYPATVTGPDGAFAFDVHSQTWWYWAVAPGHTPSRCCQTTVRTGDITVDIILGGATGALAGIVRWPEGRPAAGAIVGIYPQGDPAVPQQLVATDRLGRFSAPNLGIGIHRIVTVLANRGYGLADCCIVAGETANVTVDLESGCTVRGVVGGLTSESVENTRVSCQRPQPHHRPEDFLLFPAAALRSDGSFELRACPPGPTLLGACDVTKSANWARTVRLDLPATGEVLTTIDFPSVPLAVRVEDPQGHGLPGLPVLVVHDVGGDGRTFLRAATDEEGQVEFANPPRTPTRIEIYAGERAAIPDHYEPVVHDSMTVRFDPRHGSVEGLLVTDDGLTRFVRLRHRPTGRAATESTENGGRFRFAVPQGDYVLECSASDRGELFVPVRSLEVNRELVDVGEIRVAPPGDLSLVLTSGSGPVQVRLVAPSGLALPPAQVALDQPWLGRLPAGEWSVGYPDTDGSPRTMPCAVRADAPTRIELVRAEGIPCSLRLTPSGHLKMTNRRVFVRVRALATHNDLWFGSRLNPVEADGALRFQFDLAPGDYCVTADAPELGRAEGLLSVKIGQRGQQLSLPFLPH